MIIDYFELYTAKLKLKKPFITSLGVIEFSDHIFLKVYSENGEFGWGECAPTLPAALRRLHQPGRGRPGACGPAQRPRCA